MIAKEIIMSGIIDIISRIPLFSGLPDEQIKAIKQIAVEKKMNRGQTIFSEGDPGKGFYVVAKGRVKIYKVSVEGKNVLIKWITRTVSPLIRNPLSYAILCNTV